MKNNLITIVKVYETIDEVEIIELYYINKELTEEELSSLGFVRLIKNSWEEQINNVAKLINMSPKPKLSILNIKPSPINAELRKSLTGSNWGKS